MMKDLILGIGFGSESIYVASLNSKNNSVQLVENSTGEYRTLAYIKENSDHSFIVGTNAKKKDGIFWLRDVNQTSTFTFNESKYNIKDFCIHILQYIKDFCQKKFGDVLLRSVISLPIYFSKQLCSLIEKCANQVGLNTMAVINEPTAITLNYWQNNPSSSLEKSLEDRLMELIANSQNNPSNSLTNLIVYDLGARSLTISKVDIIHNILILIKSAIYSLHKGLNVWVDQQIEYFLKRANKELTKNYPDAAINQAYLKKKIAASLESALLSLNEKKELIVAINEPIGLNGAMPIFLPPLSEKGIDKTYEIFTSPLKSLVSNPFDYTLIMAGGGSHLKEIKNQIDALGFKEVIHFNNSEQASALGACWYGAIISGHIPGKLVLSLTNNLIEMDHN